MTKEWYQARGFNVSTAIDQAKIDRAEGDVMKAYVQPILPDLEFTDDGTDEAKEFQMCLANLAYLRMMQTNSLFVTRSGLKEKTNTNSQNADQWRALSVQAQSAAMALETLEAREDADADAEVKDICGIYLRTHLLGM